MFLDKAGYDKIVSEISRMGKLISVSTVTERFKISGYFRGRFSSLARKIIRDLANNGQLKYLEPHSRQVLAISTAPPKKADDGAAKATTEGKEVRKAGKKAGKQ